jgi:hypothetical protein
VSPDHTAARPSGECRVCDKPRPCDRAREALAGEFDSMRLAVFMWLNLEEAATHLNDEPASDLFERFIRWTR